MGEMNLVESIKELREAMGDVSQVTFAVTHLGKSLTMVQRYERGENIAVRDLAVMVQLSRGANRPDLAATFKKALIQSVGPEVVDLIREGADEENNEKTATESNSHQGGVPARRRKAG